MASAETTITGIAAVVRVGLEVAQQLEAADVGQVHVEQDQVRQPRPHRRQAVEAGQRDLQLHLRRAAPGCRA